jgi:hypothetical protein
MISNAPTSPNCRRSRMPQSSNRQAPGWSHSLKLAPNNHPAFDRIGVELMTLKQKLSDIADSIASTNLGAPPS